MDTDQLTNGEVELAAKALSIHRSAQRRKLNRLRRGSPEYAATLAEVEDSQRLLEKLTTVDLQRLSRAS